MLTQEQSAESAAYLRAFGLHDHPFRLAPDAKFAFVTHSMSEALTHGRNLIHGRHGLGCISGEIGTGKTTLAHLFARESDSRDRVASLYRIPGGTRQTAAGILYEINRDLGIETKERQTSERSLRKLEAFAFEQAAKNESVVILIDDAHLLRAVGVATLLAICNMTTVTAPMVQILLFGQAPEMQAVIAADRALHSRLAMHTTLQTLTGQEVGKMLATRLAAVGRDDSIFHAGAVAVIAKASCGIPRIICTLANRACMEAANEKAKFVDNSHAERAVRALFHEEKAQ